MLRHGCPSKQHRSLALTKKHVLLQSDSDDNNVKKNIAPSNVDGVMNSQPPSQKSITMSQEDEMFDNERDKQLNRLARGKQPHLNPAISAPCCVTVVTDVRDFEDDHAYARGCHCVWDVARGKDDEARQRY